MQTTAGPHPHRWLAFAAILAVSLMDLLDATVANVAGPAIQEDLGGSYADVQWIAAGYTLAMAVGLLTGGRLGDILGRRRVLLGGLAGFTLASVLCAAATSPEMLIAARVAQGGLGAVMLPQGFGLMREMFAPHEMGRAFGITGPVMGMAAILGPIVAGLLIDADIAGTGWRSIFLLNVPIAAVAFAIGIRHLPKGAPTGAVTRLDAAGVALAGAGSFLLVFPLVQGREHGWPAWSFAMLAAAGVVLGAFGFHQARRKRSGGTPLVEPSLFRKRSYVAGVSFAMVFFAAIGGFTLAVSAFLQVGLGFTAEHAGLTMATWAAGAFAGTAVGALTMARLGRRVLQLGLVVMGIGLIGAHAVLGAAGIGVGSWDLAGPLVVYGLGMGMIFAPLYDIALGDVETHEVGSASGVQQAIQQLGVSLGVAVIGTVFFDRIAGAGAVEAARWAIVATVVLSAVALYLTTKLPRREGAGHVVPAAA